MIKRKEIKLALYFTGINLVLLAILGAVYLQKSNAANLASSNPETDQVAAAAYQVSQSGLDMTSLISTPSPTTGQVSPTKTPTPSSSTSVAPSPATPTPTSTATSSPVITPTPTPTSTTTPTPSPTSTERNDYYYIAIQVSANGYLESSDPNVEAPPKLAYPLKRGRPLANVSVKFSCSTYSYKTVTDFEGIAYAAVTSTSCPSTERIKAKLFKHFMLYKNTYISNSAEATYPFRFGNDQIWNNNPEDFSNVTTDAYIGTTKAQTRADFLSGKADNSILEGIRPVLYGWVYDKSDSTKRLSNVQICAYTRPVTGGPCESSGFYRITSSLSGTHNGMYLYSGAASHVQGLSWGDIQKNTRDTYDPYLYLRRRLQSSSGSWGELTEFKVNPSSLFPDQTILASEKNRHDALIDSSDGCTTVKLPIPGVSEGTGGKCIWASYLMASLGEKGANFNNPKPAVKSFGSAFAAKARERADYPGSMKNWWYKTTTGSEYGMVIDYFTSHGLLPNWKLFYASSFGKSRSQQICNMQKSFLESLDAGHPVVIYVTAYGKHVIVVTGYKTCNGKTTYYFSNPLPGSVTLFTTSVDGGPNSFPDLYDWLGGQTYGLGGMSASYIHSGTCSY